MLACLCVGPFGSLNTWVAVLLSPVCIIGTDPVLWSTVLKCLLGYASADRMFQPSQWDESLAESHHGSLNLMM